MGGLETVQEMLGRGGRSSLERCVEVTEGEVDVEVMKNEKMDEP